jgi:hypothetical protein
MAISIKILRCCGFFFGITSILILLVKGYGWLSN